MRNLASFRENELLVNESQDLNKNFVLWKKTHRVQRAQLRACFTDVSPVIQRISLPHQVVSVGGQENDEGNLVYQQ